MVKKTKPVLHDPQIISRVQQYLEENVDKTYVDVAIMAKELQTRWPEYSRRKTVPFRQLVEQAYKTVLHSYGLDSNPSSEEDGSDVEVMSNRPNQMGDTLNNLYSAGGKKAGSSNDDPIDISSDESEDEEKNETVIEGHQQQGTKNRAVEEPVLENGTARPSKKRKTDDGTEKSTGSSSRSKKYKKEIVPKTSKTTFADVGGMEKTLKQLCELLMHLKHPEIYTHIGLPPPRGFLLHGPPGSGKTLLAHAIAGQLAVPLIEVPATELVAGVSGESEERIRDVFDQTAALAPCVLFLDEIDAISSNRINASKDMERRIVAQLINSLDGLATRPNGNQVLVIGATNRADVLDPSLRRIGRFDQEISLGIPDRSARKEILQIICKNLKLDILDFDEIAALTPGYVGADLLALATRAASTAVKRIFKAKEADIPKGDSEMSKEVGKLLDQLDADFDTDDSPTAAPAPKQLNGDTVEIIDDEMDEDVPALLDDSIEIEDTDGTKKKDIEVEEAESVVKLVAKFSEEVAKSIQDEPMDTDDVVTLLEDEKSTKAAANTEHAAEETKDTTTENQSKTEEKPSEGNAETSNADTSPTAENGGKQTETAEKIDEETEKPQKKETEIVDKSEKSVDLTEEPAIVTEGAEKSSNEENSSDTKAVESTKTENSVETPKLSDGVPTTTKSQEPVTPKILEAVSLTPEEMAKLSDDADDPAPKEQHVVGGTKALNLNDMLSWLNSATPPLSQTELDQLKITRDDFLDALKLVQPSAKREGFITVPDVTWNDIGSLKDIREELKLAIIAPVKFPERLKVLGLTAPSGVLLCGPPGCGKTLLAKAIANEAGINFISVKGPELLNMYVGESERAVRQVFQRARNSAPCVIFFDEFDALCPKRSDSGENTAGQRVVNQLLTEMDGIEERRGVFLMAATNRPDIVDPAVLRPGRFDKILYVGLPTTYDRMDILYAITQNGTRPPLADDVEMVSIAEATEAFTGADLAGLIRQASLYALKSSITDSGDGDIDTSELKVHREHIFSALKNIKPSVSVQDKVHYEKLKKKYGHQADVDAMVP